MILSASSSPFKTTISRVDRAVRASPLANSAIISSISEGIATFCLPNPLGSDRARERSVTRSSLPNPCMTNTLQRDSSALLISKEGFSVVAPIRMMLPFSTKGRKASCWALLKRWISSTNRMVFSPYRRFSSAFCMTVRISLIPLVTAEKLIKAALVRFAITRASVVFPTPGGPQKIMEEMWSLSIKRRRTFPLPSRWSCPTNASRVCGRRRAAKGMVSSRSKSVICSISMIASHPLFLSI